MIEYGQLSTGNVGSASGEPGLGTYSAYIAGSRVHLDLHPTVSTASTYVANTIHVDYWKCIICWSWYYIIKYC